MEKRGKDFESQMWYYFGTLSWSSWRNRGYSFSTKIIHVSAFPLFHLKCQASHKVQGVSGAVIEMLFSQIKRGTLLKRWSQHWQIILHHSPSTLAAASCGWCCGWWMVLQDGVGFYEKLWMSDPRWRGAPPSQWGCHPSPPLSLQSTNILSRACTHPPPTTTTTIATTSTAITITSKHQHLDSTFTPPSSTSCI